MKITFARVGALALAVTLASLAAHEGARRSTARVGELFDPESGDWVAYDALVFADQWLAQAGAR